MDIFLYLPNVGPLEHPYGLEEASDLVVATMERSGVLIIGFVMANLPYIQSFRSLELSGRPNNVSVVNYFVSVVNYLAKTVPASDAPSAILAKTDCIGQMTSVSAENDSLLAETVAFRFEVLKSPR